MEEINSNSFLKTGSDKRPFIIGLSFLFLAGGFNFSGFSQQVSETLRLKEASPEIRKQPGTIPAAENRWTIGIYTGQSPFQLSSPDHIKNPVLTAEAVNDIKADIVAHPFLIATNSMYYMFFTTKDGTTDKGGIGLAESKDGFNWKYRQIVLLEPFVLSHPCVFEWKEDY